eukprot:TRINITY_DN9839_c0_g1_i1.p1 TRINITY_DN9839_c0_g1~~TRINITY_DN9839_c0_g1_i1.p1  ORF type:complete len:733 (+),score=77.84 TRINITY_DN9839_c0_g1_i1:78-2276(+)
MTHWLLNTGLALVLWSVVEASEALLRTQGGARGAVMLISVKARLSSYHTTGRRGVQDMLSIHMSTTTTTWLETIPPFPTNDGASRAGWYSSYMSCPVHYRLQCYSLGPDTCNEYSDLCACSDYGPDYRTSSGNLYENEETCCQCVLSEPVLATTAPAEDKRECSGGECLSSLSCPAGYVLTETRHMCLQTDCTLQGPNYVHFASGATPDMCCDGMTFCSSETQCRSCKEAEPLSRSWESVAGPGSFACRGNGTTDNSANNYEVHEGVTSIEECHSKCLENQPRCKGVEFSSGRCELWVREGGIHAAVRIGTGFSCERYGWPVQQLQPVDGGANRVCRGSSSEDNSDDYFVLAPTVLNLEDCKARCAAAAHCFGIEFNSGYGRCEIWTRPIGTTANINGYTCLRFDVTAVGASTTTSPFVGTSLTTTQPNSSSTSSSPSLRRSWEFVAGPGSFACRGNGTTDNLASNYEVQAGVNSIEECHSKCLENQPRCKGVEFSSGRCELWVREGGIHAAIRIGTGFSCERYGWPVQQLQPVDGGANRVCRGSSSEDNSDDYFVLAPTVLNLEDCKARCAAAAHCFGIEFNSGYGRCEIWTRPIGTTANINGYTCLRFDVTAVGASTTTSPFVGTSLTTAQPSSSSTSSHSEAATSTSSISTSCTWTVEADKVSHFFASGLNANFDLEGAKTKCLELESSCKAVTCYANGDCTVRASATLGDGFSGETTHVPEASCFPSR